MDLNSIKPAERIIEILHPATEEELGVSVSVISVLDNKTAALRRKIQNKRIELERRGKSFTASDIEENEMDLLLNCITGWEWKGNATFNNEKPEFNEKNVKSVLKELPWFKQQIMEAIGDEKSFFLS